MARRRKPGRPKGSKNKKKVGRPRSKARASGRKKAGKKRSKATPAQLRALKKARAARASNLKPAKKKRKKATAAQLANLKKARAARELKNMPKTKKFKERRIARQRLAGGPILVPLSSLHEFTGAPTVRIDGRHKNPHVAALYSARRRSMPTLISAS